MKHFSLPAFFTQDEVSVLNKGLKFVPLRKSIDEFQTLHDTDAFFRRLRLKAHFHDAEDNSSSEDDRSPTETLIDQLFPTKSTWTPLPGKYNALDYYINKCKHELSKINLKKTCSRPNLTKNELTALNNLKKRTDIVIKPADKGGCVVVWRRDLYVKEGASQLDESTNFYVQQKKDPTKAFNKTIITRIKEEIANENLPENATEL